MPALSQIKPEDEREVRAVLERIAILPRASGAWRIARLESLTNRSFLVEPLARGQQGAAPGAGMEAYVLRLPGTGTELYIDRAAEALNAGLAAGIGLSPLVLHADPATGIMLSRFLPGALPLSSAALRAEEHFRAAIGLLRRLHASGLAFRGEMRLYPKLDQYLTMAGTPALRALRRAGERLRPLVEPGWGPARPCHIDPAPHNFIAAAGRHFLLDWEYSAMCEPLWDLAGLSIEAHFDSGQDAAMVALYFAEATQAEIAAWISRLHLYRIMLRLVAAAWGAVQIAQGNGEGTAAQLVDPLVEASGAELESQGLAAHIAAAT
jgi:thiamine kinase-like enzyme